MRSVLGRKLYGEPHRYCTVAMGIGLALKGFTLQRETQGELHAPPLTGKAHAHAEQQWVPQNSVAGMEEVAVQIGVA